MKNIVKAILVSFIFVLTVSDVKFGENIYSIEDFSYQATIEEARAGDTAYDHKMMTENCWVNNQPIQICRYYPPYLCDISGQDACSEIGEN